MQIHFNKRKSRRLGALLLGILINTGSIHAYESLYNTEQMLPREGEAPRLSLNGTWKFKYVEGELTDNDENFYNENFPLDGWKSIKVPSNWELQGFSTGKKYGKKVKKGTGLYSRTIDIPASWKGENIYITFDGVSNDCAVYVNGKKAGYYNSAFNRKTFDITQYVTPGATNRISVQANTQPRTYLFDINDDWALNGIHRNVTLFALPKTHIRDVEVKSHLVGNDAEIDVNLSLIAESKRNANITGTLTDSQGRTAGTFNSTLSLTPGNNDFTNKINVSNPNLWNAETPNLYNLTIILSDVNGILQTRTERIGIREITTENGVLKLNGTPIKLHGATHHDMSPIHGRSITEEEMKNDLKLMRDANMNFIRTSHYPPNERLLELCDSIGMYVMDEVPYGFGEPLLEDESYLPELLLRADLTLVRDKNHPSVIMWSVGNENPATPIGLETGKHVYRIDPTRPYSFPQGPKDFLRMAENMPDSLPALSPHYPTYEQMEEWSEKFEQPMVVTEYAHALGTDFGQMQRLYEIMWSKPKVAGGSVWELFDQGIATKTKPMKSKWDYTDFVWTAKDTIYDTNGCDGTDGLMYADRFPKTNYWQARKVYSYVIVPDTTINVTSGVNNIGVKMINRYDFTNLNSVSGKWRCLADGKVVANGTFSPTGAPHTTTIVNIPVNIPEGYADYWMELDFTDKNGNQFYEKSIRLAKPTSVSLKDALAGNTTSKIKTGKNSVVTDSYNLDITPDNGMRLTNSNGKEIISDGLISKVGRKITMTDKITRGSRRVKKYPFWDKLWMKASNLDIKKLSKNEMELSGVFASDTVVTDSSTVVRRTEGTVKLTFTSNGWIDVEYDLNAIGEGASVEAGYGLLLPAGMDVVRWLGNGPYASYPSKDRLSEYGVWQMHSDDIYFPGNRMHVNAAVVSDNEGNGFVLLTDDANVSFERYEEGILISHNAWQTSAFNKHTWPEGITLLQDINLKGKFSIMPVTGEWSPKMRELFGESTKNVPVNAPYFHSYDQ